MSQNFRMALRMRNHFAQADFIARSMQLDFRDGDAIGIDPLGTARSLLNAIPFAGLLWAVAFVLA